MTPRSKLNNLCKTGFPGFKEQRLAKFIIPKQNEVTIEGEVYSIGVGENNYPALEFPVTPSTIEAGYVVRKRPWG